VRNDELYKDMEGSCPSLMQVVLDIAFRASEQQRKSLVRKAGGGKVSNRIHVKYQSGMSSLQHSATWRSVI
jgi:hypothetical protein